MKTKKFLLGLSLMILFAIFLSHLKNSQAIGQNEETSVEVTEQQILDKLDQIIANQNTIFSKLDEIQALVDNTRVRATR